MSIVLYSTIYYDAPSKHDSLTVCLSVCLTVLLQVDGYLVEYYTTNPVYEVQVITTSSGPRYETTS